MKGGKAKSEEGRSRHTLRGLAGNGGEQGVPPRAAGSPGGLGAGQKTGLIYVFKATLRSVWQLVHSCSKTG